MYIHNKNNVQELKMVYIQHVQGLCQSRLSTADYALLLVAFTTAATQEFSSILWDLKFHYRDHKSSPLVPS
jgi:hypothetical protein